MSNKQGARNWKKNLIQILNENNRNNNLKDTLEKLIEIAADLNLTNLLITLQVLKNNLLRATTNYERGIYNIKDFEQKHAEFHANTLKLAAELLKQNQKTNQFNFTYPAKLRVFILSILFLSILTLTMWLWSTKSGSSFLSIDELPAGFTIIGAILISILPTFITAGVLLKKHPKELVQKQHEEDLNSSSTSVISSLHSPLLHFSSRIKEIWLELYDYQFYHSPFSKDVPANRDFLGRATAKARIITLLKQTVTNSGAYLITGFRGMGKTSLVRLAIEEYNNDLNISENHSVVRKRYILIAIGVGVFSLLYACLLLLFPELINNLPNEFSKYSIGLLVPIGILILLRRLVPHPSYLTILVLAIYTLLLLNLTLFAFTKLSTVFATYEPEGLSLWSIISCLCGLYFGLLLLRFAYDIAQFKFRSTDNDFDKKLAYQAFEINLSQDEIGERSILKRLTQELARYWREELNEEDYHQFYSPIYLPVFWFLQLMGQRSSKYTYRKIRNRLDLLEQRLSAEIIAQENSSVNPSFATRTGLGLGKVVLPAFDYSKQNQATFPIASAKEVEDQLIHIFKDIEQFRKKNSSIPRFLFIIDELDKIEPNSSTTISDRESSDPIFDLDTSIQGGNRVRQRQEAIAALLANLKGFLNIARAKFIFIGGREMYDASLADIADRDSFYSSIFNDVIYVSSFFKDKTSDRAGVTQMTVAYLCHLFFAPGRTENSLTLKTLAKHIGHPLQKEATQLSLHYGGPLLRPKMANDNSTKDVLRQQLPLELTKTGQSELDLHLFRLAKAKVVAALQNYAIYLTYRSNGTPKKLISLIERNIRLAPEIEKEREYLIVTQNRLGASKIKERMFLRLKFDFQYEIGLTSNLYRPFIVSNSRYLKALGDKLLFSSAFIFDHILKFHPFGFSWRNLELIPEVILINKEPNLRQFIESLIRFLSKQYIRPTVSGVFTYKFFSKTAIELSLVSRISDLGAAAFNFTLDESLQIKRYYKRKLTELQEKYHRSDRAAGQFVHSISFIQSILGDLHYYDKEYDDALVYYTEAIQFLRVNNKSANITKHQFLLWLRTKLKAGLTLEKMRAFDSVFSYYRTVIFETPLFLDSSFKDHKDHKWAYRSLQLLTKPLVAWLAAIEKQRFDGITHVNLQERLRDLNTLLVIQGTDTSKYHDGERQDFLYGDYLNNVGSILFYKNKYFDQLLEESDFLHLASVPLQKGLKVHPKQHEDAFFTSSQAAFLYYSAALNKLIRPHIRMPLSSPSPTPAPLLLQALQLLSPIFAHTLSAEKSYYIANVISKIGDAILATSQEPIADKNVFDFASYVAQLAKPQQTAFYECIGTDFSRFTTFSPSLAMRVYLLAYAFYHKAGRTYSAAFQLKKILFCLRDIGSSLNGTIFKSTKNVKTIMDNLEGIAMQTFRLLSSTTDIANRPQILKYQDMLGLMDTQIEHTEQINGKAEQRSIVYNMLTTSSDTREVILSIEEIRLRLYKRCAGAFTNQLPVNLARGLHLGNLFISPYSMANSRFLRLLELKYRCEVFYCYIKNILKIPALFEVSPKEHSKENLLKHLEKQLSFKQIPKLIQQLVPVEFKEQLSWLELFSFLVVEGIFCTREIIRTINLFSPGYIISYSFLADNHRRMASWCQAYRNLQTLMDANERSDLHNHLEHILGNNAISGLEPNYHRELALVNFAKATDMHTEGRLYKAYILNTYALEDDYNDNFSHFCAALERYRLNNGSIHKKIKHLNKALETSRLYNYQSYFPLDHSEIVFEEE